MNFSLYKNIAKLFGLAYCLAPAAMGEETTAGKPNIVFIISDDHDYEHLGFMGNRIVHTPNLDRLADEGVVFTTCHLTSSVCRPSLASLLSGRYPHQTGIYANYHKANRRGNDDIVGEKMLSSHQSLPNLLKQAGYATYVSGKYWEGDVHAMGFTGFEDGVEQRGNFHAFARKGQDTLFEFIDTHAGETPMFLWWAPMLPHRPHDPAERFLNLFDPQQIPIPDYIKPSDRKAFVELEHLSLAMEAWLDEEFGKLRAKMIEEGLDENTLYVFLVDNGWSNGLPSKGSVFEKGLRTPVVFTFPGRIAGGAVRDDLIGSLDIFPTVLDFAGASIPGSAEGKNLRPFIESGAPVGREKLFGARYPTGASYDGQFPERDVYALYLRSQEWKYVYYTRDVQGELTGRPFRIQHILADAPFRQRGDVNLYNLIEDPYELNDLSASPEFQEKLSGFKQEVLKWWRDTGGDPIELNGSSSVPPFTVIDN